MDTKKCFKASLIIVHLKLRVRENKMAVVFKARNHHAHSDRRVRGKGARSSPGWTKAALRSCALRMTRAGEAGRGAPTLRKVGCHQVPANIPELPARKASPPDTSGEGEKLPTQQETGRELGLRPITRRMWGAGGPTPSSAGLSNPLALQSGPTVNTGSSPHGRLAAPPWGGAGDCPGCLCLGKRLRTSGRG